MTRDSWSLGLPTAWQCIRTPPGAGVDNMAMDLALMDAARHTGVGLWRTYAWSHPTVSFGRNEATQGRYSPASVAAAGLEAVRRPTGGRALLHDAEVTYSVALPIPDSMRWRTAYDAINRVLLTALQALGVPAVLVTGDQGRVPVPDGPVCFDAPAPGEIAVHGAKLVGSAVWRERGAYLQHGSILLIDTQARLTAAQSRPADTPAPAAAALHALCATPPTWEQVATALETALAATGVTLTPAAREPWDPGQLAAHRAALADPAWCWRR